jgi:hypothetical protein
MHWNTNLVPEIGKNVQCDGKVCIRIRIRVNFADPKACQLVKWRHEGFRLAENLGTPPH